MHKSSITKTDNTKVLSKQKSTVKKTYAHEYTSLFHVRVYIREREREREREEVGEYLDGEGKGGEGRKGAKCGEGDGREGG